MKAKYTYFKIEIFSSSAGEPIQHLSAYSSKLSEFGFSELGCDTQVFS